MRYEIVKTARVEIEGQHTSGVNALRECERLAYAHLTNAPKQFVVLTEERNGYAIMEERGADGCVEVMSFRLRPIT